ncbi:MAG: hypothetical protein G8345_07755 [Magnetococcales bacterium]|nr:hypothetical protein [Magnetococcales bacterium]NGZ26770.1 hypothetical protein [Magnetococcales bacterium]
MSQLLTAHCTVQVDNTSPRSRLAIQQGEILQQAVLFYRLLQHWQGNLPQHPTLEDLAHLARQWRDRPALQSTLEFVGSVKGLATLKVYYTGTDNLEVEVIRGTGEIKAEGEREESVDKAIHFSGEQVIQVTTHKPPVLIHATPFYDLHGQRVDPPTYVQREDHGVYLTDRPVYGSLVVTLLRSYRLYHLFYPPGEENLVLHQDGELEWLGGSLPSAMVMARSRHQAAICTVHKSVILVDRTMQWYQQTRQRSLLRVEVERKGVVDRVFPSSPLSNAPPLPDPITGRSDYLDVERTIQITFRQEYQDYRGQVYREIIQENFANPAPDNSFILSEFSRSSEDETRLVVV